MTKKYIEQFLYIDNSINRRKTYVTLFLSESWKLSIFLLDIEFCEILAITGRITSLHYAVLAGHV